MKKCSKCKVKKELNEFSIRKINKDGYNIWCKKCCKIYYNKYTKNNKKKKKLNNTKK